MINKPRLIKLLNLTRSDNDHEALSAMRSANRMVDGDWEWLLGTGEQREEKPIRTPDPKIMRMVQFCKDSGLLIPNTLALLVKLEKKVRGGGTLSDRDRERLASIFHKCGGGPS